MTPTYLLTCAILISAFPGFTQEALPKKETIVEEATILSYEERTEEKATSLPKIEAVEKKASIAAAPTPKVHKTFLQGEQMDSLNPAYNLPATYAVRSDGSVSFFSNASITYWYAGEEGLTLANNGIYNDGNFLPVTTRVLQQSFDFEPGFKAGLGMTGNKEWALALEYTWFRGKSKTSSGAPLTSTGNIAGWMTPPITGNDVWVINDWFLQSNDSGTALSGSVVTSAWELDLDLIDFTFSRPFYQAPFIVISPFAGLRTAFIRQTMTINLTENTELFVANTPLEPLTSHNNSKAWSIGPRIGVGGQCLVEQGIRFVGDIAASLLFTRYTEVKHSEDIASTAFNAGPYTASMSNYDCLRPNAELGLGLGWGTYLDNENYHLDFALDYDFQIFWSQNMMRKLLDDTIQGIGPSTPELYLHGLTFTTRFDF